MRPWSQWPHSKAEGFELYFRGKRDPANSEARNGKSDMFTRMVLMALGRARAPGRRRIHLCG